MGIGLAKKVTASVVAWGRREKSQTMPERTFIHSDLHGELEKIGGAHVILRNLQKETPLQGTSTIKTSGGHHLLDFKAVH